MIPEFDLAFALLTLIVLMAAATAGLAGFGFSIVSVPLLLIFYEPSTVLALNKILTLGTMWVILVGIWRDISWRHLRSLFPFALSGLVVGVWVLKALDADAIRLIAGVSVCLFALLLLSGMVRHVAERPWMAPVAGLASGALSTSTGMAGPPLVLFFTMIAMPVNAFRATTASYFLLTDVVAFPALISQGIIVREDVVLSIWMAPVAMLGRWVGSLLVPFVTPTSFRRLVLVMLLATGGIAVANALVFS